MTLAGARWSRTGGRRDGLGVVLPGDGRLAGGGPLVHRRGGSARRRTRGRDQRRAVEAALQGGRVGARHHRTGRRRALHRGRRRAAGLRGDVAAARSGLRLAATADASNRGNNYLLSFGRLRPARRSTRRAAAGRPRRADDPRAPRGPLHVHGPRVARRRHRRRQRAGCGCCSAPPCCCCSSPARTSRTCCSRGRWSANATSPFARRSAPAARQLFGQVIGETRGARAARQRGRRGAGVGAAPRRSSRWHRPTSRASRPSPSTCGCWASRVGAAVVAGLVAGLPPAVHLLRADVNAVVRAVPAAAPPPGAPAARADCSSSARWPWPSR